MRSSFVIIRRVLTFCRDDKEVGVLPEFVDVFDDQLFGQFFVGLVVDNLI